MSAPSTDASEKHRKKSIAEAGHWRKPLDGHGLAYFDELVVAYRTLPAHGTEEDPWARASAAAANAAGLESAAAAAAARGAEQAAALSQATPADANLQADAAAKAKLAADAKARSDQSNKELARLEGAVGSKLAAAQIIIELIQKKERKEAVWSDILTFESALLRMVWFDALKLQLLGLREEYRQVLGASAAAAMAPSYLDLVEMKEKDFLRVQAEAASLMRDIHWQLVSSPRLEWQKTWMTITLTLYTSVICLLLVLAAFFSGCSTPALVLLAGAIGAALSAFQRIQHNGGTGAALLNLRNCKWGSISVGVAPIIGALSALLLSFIFTGGIITGQIFPKITLRAEGCGTNGLFCCGSSAPGTNPVAILQTSLPPVTVAQGLAANGVPSNAVFVTNLYGLTNQLAASSTNATVDPTNWRDCKSLCQHCWCVAGGADLALLFVWAFIAGFSERLVPDMLSRLAKKAEEKV